MLKACVTHWYSWHLLSFYSWPVLSIKFTSNSRTTVALVRQAHCYRGHPLNTRNPASGHCLLIWSPCAPLAMSSIVGGRTNGCQGPIELTCASWERRQRVIIKLSNGYEDELCGLVEARCIGFYYFRHLDFCLNYTLSPVWCWAFFPGYFLFMFCLFSTLTGC